MQAAPEVRKVGPASRRHAVASVEGVSDASARLALDAIRAGVFDWDLSSGRLAWDARVRELLGVPPDTPPDMDAWLARIHPDDLDGVRARLAHVLDGRAPDGRWQLRHRVQRAGGGWRWVDLSGRGVFQGRGAARRCVRLVGLVADVGERAEAEQRLAASERALRESLEALRESESRYRQLFDVNPHPMWVFDLETLRFLAVNDAALAQYGYARDEMLGMTIADIRPAEELPAMRQAVRIAGSERLTHGGVWRHRRKDGSAIEVQIVSHGLQFAGRPARLVLALDVTARRRAEDALRDRTAQLESLLTSAPLGVAFFDRRHRYVRVNETIARINGIPASEHLGHTVEELLPGVAPSPASAIDQVFATGEPLGGIEVHGETPRDPGVRRHWLTGWFPVRDAVGAVVMVGVWVTEISELKRIEDALREADRRKDEFLATLAHELRNPLAPVANAARLLAREPTLGDPGRRAVEMVERQVRQMKRLVDDLLEVSRISRGTIALRPERLQLGALVAAAVDAAQPAALAKRQSLAAAGPPGPMELVADPVRVSQVLENLLSNAVKYTPEGGSIRVELADAGDAAEIRVSDDGIGIPREKLESVFGLFVQAEPGVGAHQDGLGIGLALVQQLVELHGGTVRADSPGPGQGATFTVRLPRIRQG